MLVEVKAAVNFIARILQTTGRVNKDIVDLFRNSLESRLHRHYDGHWFPERPHKGSGYRCIRINHRLDPILDLAAKDSGISNLLNYFPIEFTLWIDPYDVSYRIGENGSIGQVYSGPDDLVIPQPKSDLTTQQSYYDSSITAVNSVLNSCKSRLREFESTSGTSAMYAPFTACVSS